MYFEIIPSISHHEQSAFNRKMRSRRTAAVIRIIFLENVKDVSNVSNDFESTRQTKSSNSANRLGAEMGAQQDATVAAGPYDSHCRTHHAAALQTKAREASRLPRDPQSKGNASSFMHWQGAPFMLHQRRAIP